MRKSIPRICINTGHEIQNKTKLNKLKQVRWDSLIPILQMRNWDSEPGPVLRFPSGLIHVPWGFPPNQYVGDTGLMPLTNHFRGLLGSLGWWPLAQSSLPWTHSSFSSHHCICSLTSYCIPWDGNDWEAQIIFIKRDRLGMQYTEQDRHGLHPGGDYPGVGDSKIGRTVEWGASCQGAGTQFWGSRGLGWTQKFRAF